NKYTRAAPATIVDPVIAIGSYTQLTEPAKDNGSRGLHRYSTEKGDIVRNHIVIARKRYQSLRGSRSPIVSKRFRCYSHSCISLSSCISSLTIVILINMVAAYFFPPSIPDRKAIARF